MENTYVNQKQFTLGSHDEEFRSPATSRKYWHLIPVEFTYENQL